MAMRLQASFDLGTTGLLSNLRAQLATFAAPSTWTDSGSPISAGFGDQGNGHYVWEGTAPDGFDGIVRFYNAATSAIYGAGFASKYRYVGPVDVNTAQAVPTTNAANSLGDCLNGARAQAFGEWAIDVNARTLKIYGPGGIAGGVVVHAFSLDSVTAPTTRTDA
jgi:hypothetical protein